MNRSLLSLLLVFLATTSSIAQSESKLQTSLRLSEVRSFVNDTTVLRYILPSDFAEIEEISKAKFQLIYVKNRKLSVAEPLPKKDSSVTITCIDKTKIVFKDKHPQDDWEIEEYFYVGSFPEIQTHLIDFLGYEWGGSILVNEKICHSIRLIGTPIFTSDYSNVVCYSNDNYEFSEVGIYSHHASAISLDYAFELNLIIDEAVFDEFGHLYLHMSGGNNPDEDEGQFFKVVFKGLF